MVFVAACVTVLQVVIIITRSPMANWAMMSASARATTLLAMVIIIRRAMAASVTALNSAISSSVRAARLAALRLRCLIRTLQWRRATGAAFQICLFMPVSGPCKSFMLLTLVVRLHVTLLVVSDARRASRNLTSTGSGSWSLITVVQNAITRMVNTTLVPAIYERGGAAETMRACFQAPTSS